ncbi:MAG: hypothetical protein IJ501_06430 [Bacilli bacterium]|nr:hypothetical protein [Bacilli bacterium]
MKSKKFKIILLIILILGLTGCNNIKPKNPTTNIDKVDYKKSVLNSTVNIYTDSLNYGSGFVYENSCIITNYHVVSDSKDIKVVTYNKDE